MKTIGVATRATGAVIDLIGSARKRDRRWVRPQPLRWLRGVSLDRRLAPYSALGEYLPPDSEYR